MESFETNSFNIYNPTYSAYSSFGDNIEKHILGFDLDSKQSFLTSNFDIQPGLLSNCSLLSSEQSEFKIFADLIDKSQ